MAKEFPLEHMLTLVPRPIRPHRLAHNWAACWQWADPDNHKCLRHVVAYEGWLFLSMHERSVVIGYERSLLSPGILNFLNAILEPSRLNLQYAGIPRCLFWFDTGTYKRLQLATAGILVHPCDFPDMPIDEGETPCKK